MSSGGFASMNQDCWDCVFAYLDLNTIKSLRLTNRNFSERYVASWFTRYLEVQTTDLTAESLESLRSLAASPFGWAVNVLTVTAIVYDTFELESILASRQIHHSSMNGAFIENSWSVCTEDELSATKSSLEWMTAAKKSQDEEFPTIAASLKEILRAFGRIRTIELDAAVIRQPNVRESTRVGNLYEISQRALRVYRVVMAAIVRSGVVTNKLIVYRHTPRCCVPAQYLADYKGEYKDAEHKANEFKTDEFKADEAPSLDPPRAGAAVTMLAVSVYGHAEKSCLEDDTHSTWDENRSGPSSSSNDEKGSSAIVGMLNEMPNLETLDLRVYYTKSGCTELSMRIMQSIASQARLPSLQRFVLRGFYTDRESLLQFFNNHPGIKQLELGDVHLKSGDWSALVEQLPTILSSLQSLRVSNLWGRGAMNRREVMNLDPVWERTDSKEHENNWSYQCGDSRLVHTLVLDSDDLRKDLKFKRHPGGRAWGSPRRSRWAKARRDEFGLL